jgi:hypothetical protein
VAYIQRGNEFRVNSQTNGAQVTPAITALANGGFVVAWADESGTMGDSSEQSIKAQLYNASGSAVGSEFLVNTQTSGFQTGPRITGLTNGGFVVAWTDNSGLGDGSGASVQAQLFDAAGNRIGTEFRVNTSTTSTQGASGIAALTNGGFVVTWPDFSGTLGDSSISVKGQIYDSSGAKVGGEFLVNTQTAGAQEAPRVTGMASGGFVITWDDASGTLGDSSGGSVKAQIFDATGTKVGTEFLVNTTTGGDQELNRVAELTGGGFVIAWRDSSGASEDIKAQIFNATGTKVGTELSVNTQTAGDQSKPQVAALTDGGFVVTWTDGTFDVNSDTNIKAQLFDAAGVKVGTEFLVNTQTLSHQTNPAVVRLPDHSFVVTWQDLSGTLGDGSSWSIKAQAYQLAAAAGTPGDDTFTAPLGSERIDGKGGTDTINFGFRLVDATVTYSGNQVIVDSASSHTVLTGFEKYVFTDGTVNNADSNPLVDDLYYYAYNHDVWNAHIDADAHYDVAGWREGRDPSAFFSTSFYRALNTDVKAAGINPLSHWHQQGWQEGRLPSVAFDGAKYLAANPDVAGAHIDPLLHFLAVGASEGRQPIGTTSHVAANGFDPLYYYQQNPDVAAAGVDLYWHFQAVGWKEGRDPNAYFDVKGYLANYTDVKAAGINPLDHYNVAGWHEGRDPSVNFDTTAYLAANPDVKAAHLNPLVHFLAAGADEGRSSQADGVWA